MGKKIVNPLNVTSPKKDFMSEKPGMPAGHQENNLNIANMHPTSNDNKKTKKEGLNGSGQTDANPQVEEERNQTFVNEFDAPPPPAGSDDDSKNESKKEEDDDNVSKASKKDSEYIKFFKFYYEKTKTEHSNWTPSQITTIVSLLWKKKKSIGKAPSSIIATNKNTRRSNKPLGGKDAFKMEHKNLTKEQLDELWSKLPQESKNFWKKEGDSYCSVSAKSSDISSVKNCKNTAPVYNAMRALLKHV